VFEEAVACGDGDRYTPVRDRVSCVVRQSSDGRCLWEAGVELSSNVIHRAAKIETLPAPHRDDAIPNERKLSVTPYLSPIPNRSRSLCITELASLICSS
jgi:hypothetical protein